MTGGTFRKLQERLVDPLLTALTIMIAVLLFVVAPLQVAGALTGHYVGFVCRAFSTFGSKRQLNTMRRKAMGRIFGWKDSALSYAELYQRLAH